MLPENDREIVRIRVIIRRCPGNGKRRWMMRKMQESAKAHPGVRTPPRRCVSPFDGVDA